MPDERELCRRAAAFAIRRADGEDQIPLSEKRLVSGKDRVARVVNARGFGGRAVQFDDLKVSSGAQSLLVRIADIVASDEETGELLGDVVNPRFEFRCAESQAVMKDAALRVISRLDQFQFLTNCQNFVLPSPETLEIFVSHETGTRVAPDKFHQGGFSV